MARALCFLLAIVLLPTSRLPAQDVPLSLDVEEVYRVGGVNAPEWGQFGFAGFVSFDGSGNLYILEPSRPLVTVLNTRGGLLRIIGREGEGPGRRCPRRRPVQDDAPGRSLDRLFLVCWAGKRSPER